jgi:hypothetical protein
LPPHEAARLAAGAQFPSGARDTRQLSPPSRLAAKKCIK